MRVTPLDIRNHGFRRRMHGYDRDEVDAFLRLVAEDYEKLLRDAEALREQVVKLDTRVQDLLAQEAILKETLTTAQRLSEDLTRTATKEAEVRISEAEIQAEKVLDAAHRRAAKLAGDIREMKVLRSRMASSVRAVIETHLSLLDGLAAEPEPDPVTEARVASLSRGPTETKPGGEA